MSALLDVFFHNKMKHLRRSLTAVLAVILLTAVIAAPFPAWDQEPAPAPQPDKYPLDQKVPLDPAITVGELENGLRYFIRKNGEPANRADLRLIVHAGSILEDEDQRGLAHMVEHMAFNGSEHFAKQELVDFMESIGMRFGPDLNAFTGFDETIYMLRIPTDSAEIMETSFLILEDWAHGLTFEDEAIDMERGVIVEEWRLGQGAAERMRARQFPILLKDSRYAERMPVGKKEVIETFEYETLRRFYRTWYRPDLMAVIAVGDFDPARIEELIRQHFAGIPLPENAPPRPTYPVPDHDNTLFAIATDKEETNSTVAVYHKQPLRDQSTVGAYRQMLVERLFNAMLNQRFTEISQKPDTPFLMAISNQGPFIGLKEVFVLSALVQEGEIERGLRALYTEGERVARFGFTATELERQKTEMLRIFERIFTERRTQDSSSYAEEFTRVFLEGEPVPGIEYEYDLHKQFLPGITLDEINRLAAEWMSDRNRVVLVNAPEKESVPVPTEEELTALLESIDEQKIAPYEDTTTDEPILDELPQPGEIVSSRTIEEVGITEWELSNGVRVVLKPTDFKEDEILVRAISDGGISLAADENLIPANTADQVVAAGGLGAFSAVDLQKKLTGKAVFVRPSIGELEEGISGNASPRDAETLFQLIYLTFTAPRADPAVFDVLKAQLKAFLENRTKSPEVVFTDTLRATMQRDSPRFRPMTLEEIPKMDLEKSMTFYQDRFADASDFTFILVGNLDMETIKPLVLRYLATLPTLEREETWKNWRIPPPDGVVKRIVEKGLEPKSLTAIVFSGDFEYTLGNRNAIRAVGQILQTRLRKLLREELSGTYGVTVQPSYSKIPNEEYRVSIDLGADPDRIDELSEAIFGEIAKLQAAGPDDKEVEDVRTAESRDYETNSKQNGWWMAQIAQDYRLGEDPVEILRFPESLELLTKDVVKEAARRYLDTENYVQVTLYPEKR